MNFRQFLLAGDFCVLCIKTMYEVRLLFSSFHPRKTISAFSALIKTQALAWL